MTSNETKKSTYFRTPLVWKNIIAFIILHIGAFYGLFLMLSLQLKWQTYIYTVLITIYSGDSITIGAHRLWSHRSYKAKWPLQLFLLIGQTMAGQNCVWVWARDHRQHHKYSETESDPHDIRRGFFFSHMGWLMMRKLPQVITTGKTINTSDLDANPLVQFQKKYYTPLYLLIALFLPVWIPCHFWNENFLTSLTVAYFLRYIITLHIVWSVNSFAHLYGNRPYTKEIGPVESTFVSAISLGEGWHNYHHTFPWDYRVGELGKHLNQSYKFIELCSKLGLAYDLKSATPEMIAHRVRKHGDGTHPSAKKIMEQSSKQEFDIDPTDLFGKKLPSHLLTS